ncbi:Palmitoyltransferase [Oleoguttula sp. CCFEE 5521]
MTTIEGWEVERHETLRRRARTMGGYLEGANGVQVRIDSQEFPWDVGIWSNFCQAFGTWNVLTWVWPLARNLSVESGLVFEHNEIDEPSKPWPPPDPDRVYRVPHVSTSGEGFTQSLDPDDFRRRQEADYQRYDNGELVVRRKPFHERYEHLIDAARDDDSEAVYSDGDDPELDVEEATGRQPTAEFEGEEAWRNKEGERLADFGLDEEAEFYDEDDLPLAEVIRRRKGECGQA